MPARISLGKSDQARLARIAREAGKTREEVLRFILDHGLGTAALVLGKGGGLGGGGGARGVNPARGGHGACPRRPGAAIRQAENSRLTGRCPRWMSTKRALPA